MYAWERASQMRGPTQIHKYMLLPQSQLKLIESLVGGGIFLEGSS